MLKIKLSQEEANLIKRALRVSYNDFTRSGKVNSDSITMKLLLAESEARDKVINEFDKKGV